MAISAGSTILASDIQAIKDDVDAVTSASLATVTTSETTASTSWTDLSTTGPSVTLTTGTAVLIVVSAIVSNNTAGASSYMGWAISGASTVTPSAFRALLYESSNANDVLKASYVYLQSGLTAGSNTFTAKYQVSAGTGSFERREITVIPLGV